MKTLKADLKRALTFSGFFIAVIGTVIAGFFGAFDFILVALKDSNTAFTINGYLYAQMAFDGAYSKLFLMLLPLLCTLPFTHAFTDDMQNKFISLYITRTSRFKYLLSRTCTIALTGGIAIIAGLIILILICMLIFPPSIPSNYNLDANMLSNATFLNYLSRIPLFFINACVWALVGGIFAVLVKNKYIAYTCPFIMAYVLSSFQKRYFMSFYIFNPNEWLLPEQLGINGAYTVILILFTISFAVCVLLMKRGLKNG